ncbi:hypothetical protein A2W67_03375 [Candidatus Nomurabacteria bacterium RIFCSPLOWO2_02_40_28]|uniref:Uncharacterized protein n=2 Tax=Candidatus Nomuraibacteriota TaxID=1752729 RepID=A0A837HV96_9BACT|nr:MAG: hypothetical protein UT27_C0004G0088 [Candidatus Nomurabacteria bacterium GW2011_GWD2_39_12]KKR20950.1 MAG: hypothetical protein UT51_C0001G0088 [Candidatus Nomurabacteria bacterium GW2011_GWC2_39_41]KKR37171.1 MAG: hypothetical protein UT70_C0002G0007 [Candidatus Nomurabacteria bacterium GW2011_GWE2_40_10]KKR38899.1 MAG: hypothetical protein UT73_C0001G0087 [Candidatus Nomurabacteria bacterium GW2011_GWB1_40_11]KKR40141.1 MAG: hypothetical protein UT74_C0002G0036 [Parcubacteria group b
MEKNIKPGQSAIIVGLVQIALRSAGWMTSNNDPISFKYEGSVVDTVENFQKWVDAQKTVEGLIPDKDLGVKTITGLELHIVHAGLENLPDSVWEIIPETSSVILEGKTTKIPVE